MLFKSCELQRYTLLAADGELGTVECLYFDDKAWKIRYLLSRSLYLPHARYFLISCAAIGGIQRTDKTIDIELTRRQVGNSPPIGENQPVTRQYETEYYRYYDWPPYWEHDGSAASPAGAAVANRARRSDTVVTHPLNSRLHCSQEIFGCETVAREGAAGIVEDLVVDIDHWLIRYLHINTACAYSHKNLLIDPGWIELINLPRRMIHLDLSIDAIRRAPAFDPGRDITQEIEVRQLRHFGSPIYWRRNSSAD